MPSEHSHPTLLMRPSDDSSVTVVDMEQYEIEIPSSIQVNISSSGTRTEEELKKILWEACQDQIFDRMRVHVSNEKHENEEVVVSRPQTTANAVAAENELKLVKKRLMLLDQISEVQRQFLQKKEPRAVFGYLLSGLLDLMDSEYGFIGQIKYEDDGTMYLQTHAITNIAWNQATRQFYKENAEAGLKFYNLDTLFGHVMVNSEPVIANDPGKDPRANGIPEGHPPLNFFLGIPFFEPGGVTMNGMVGIANRPGGYSKEDIEFLEPFTLTCSNLIQAYAALQENETNI